MVIEQNAKNINKPRHFFKNSVLITACLLSSIFVGEALRRYLDGYSFQHLSLVKTAEAPVFSSEITNDELHLMAGKMIQNDNINISLFDQEPKLPKPSATPGFIRDRELAAKTSRYHVNFVFNDALLRGPDGRHYINDDFPDELYTFKSPDGSMHPRYRNYPSVHQSSGVETNSFGWRSPEIALNKPPRTIRIVALGDSTTMHQGQIQISYLDFLTHWLEVWAQSAGYDVKIEGLNTGREAISSEDIIAILRYEAMPLQPDYVLFYGLGNQWDIQPFVKFTSSDNNKPGVAGDYYKINPLVRFTFDISKPIRNFSASATWAISRLRTKVGEHGQEPQKPRQTWQLPAGLSEISPDPFNLPPSLGSARAIRDLDIIRELCAANDAQFFLQTFKFLAHEGLVLPSPQATGIFNYLNYSYFPWTYASIDRSISYLNRIYKSWATARRIPLMDVATVMPDDYRLFLDAMHNTQTGAKLRAWAVFQNILPYFSVDLKTGRLPRPPKKILSEHPFSLQIKTVNRKDIILND